MHQVVGITYTYQGRQRSKFKRSGFKGSRFSEVLLMCRGIFAKDFNFVFDHLM